MSGYEKCINAINSLRNHKKFQDFLLSMKEKMAKNGGTGLDLMSYMITPIQRIPVSNQLINGKYELQNLIAQIIGIFEFYCSVIFYC